LKSGRYIFGKELERFEVRLADYLGVKYVLGVGSGYDALYMCLLLYPSTHVYVENALHIAPSNAAQLAGHIIVDHPSATGIIIPTVAPTTGDHNYRTGIIIEDACQSIGMKRTIPKEVAASCYSFHPLKKLHCYGDGGAIATYREDIYKRLKVLRNHGRVTGNAYTLGVNSRLDEIQAAVLNVMLDKGVV